MKSGLNRIRPVPWLWKAVENRPVPLLLVLPVFFIGLGASSIWDANEAFYVETPRQMLLSGDYVNPTFNDEPRLNKPVLSYWIVAASYQLFGVSVASERLTIAAAAALILASVFLIGRAVASASTGVLAALLLATAPRFMFFSRRIAIDMFLALFMTAALAAFVLAEQRPHQRRRWLAAMYVAIGLGVLTKGPVALVLPGLAIGLWLIFERRLGDVPRLMPATGLALVLLVAAPWYVAVYVEHGFDYLRHFFLQENLTRFAEPFTTSRSPLFLLPVLFADLLMPWAPLLIVPIAALGPWRRASSGADSLRRLLWWWVVGTTAFFSLSASKEDLYILPAIPAAAVLIADALVRTRFGQDHRGVRGLLFGLAVLTLVLAAAVVWLFGDGYYQLAGAPVAAAALGLAAIAALVALAGARGRTAVVALALGLVVFQYIVVGLMLPDVERLKPVPPIARQIAAQGSPGAALAFFNMDLPSLVYYANRPAVRVGDVEAAAQLFEVHDEVWMLAGEREWEALRAVTGRACEAARHPMLTARASDLIARRPPPDVVLVTTCH